MIIRINKKKLLESLLSDSDNIELEIIELKETPIITEPKISVKLEMKKKWKLSENAIKILGSKDFEDTKLIAYPDEGGKLTIGIGHLLTEKELQTGIIIINSEMIEWKNGLTEDQVIALCIQDMDEYEKAVNNFVKVNLNQNQYDALVFLCFNIGVNGFKGSTVVKVLNKEEYEKVPDAMRMWNKVEKNGVLVISQGLINRREKEIKIWHGAYNA